MGRAKIESKFVVLQIREPVPGVTSFTRVSDGFVYESTEACLKSIKELGVDGIMYQVAIFRGKPVRVCRTTQEVTKVALAPVEYVTGAKAADVSDGDDDDTGAPTP